MEHFIEIDRHRFKCEMVSNFFDKKAKEKRTSREERGEGETRRDRDRDNQRDSNIDKDRDRDRNRYRERHRDRQKLIETEADTINFRQINFKVESRH